jgi:hypothetical protein
MAKHTEMVYDKKVNIACLLFGLALVVLAIFAFSTFSSVDLNLIDLEYLTDVIEAQDTDALGEYMSSNMGSVYAFAVVAIVAAVVSIVSFVNVIRLVVGWFGFIGKKDSRRMAKKLSKHAKIAFGTSGLILATSVVFGTAYGKIAENVKTLAIIMAVAFVITYLLVRYYRWFVVEKVSYQNYLFVLLRDAICIALPIIIFCNFVSLTAIKDGMDAMNSFVGAASSENNRRLAAALGKLFIALRDLFVLLGVFGVAKKIIKLMPFDNYRRTATKAASGKYISLIIIPLIFIAVSAVTTTVITYEAFEIDAFKEAFFAEFDIIIKLILTAIAAHVLNIVENDNELDDVKLAVAAPAEEAAPVEETLAEEAAPVEETLAEEAPGSEKSE